MDNIWHNELEDMISDMQFYYYSYHIRICASISPRMFPTGYQQILYILTSKFEKHFKTFFSLSQHFQNWPKHNMICCINAV